MDSPGARGCREATAAQPDISEDTDSKYLRNQDVSGILRDVLQTKAPGRWLIRMFPPQRLYLISRSVLRTAALELLPSLDAQAE